MPLAVSHCSCAIPAWFAAQFAPPKQVEPEYVPPKDKVILVFVDDMLNPINYEPIKIDLTNRLNEQLVANGVTAKTVPYNRLADLIAATPDFNGLAVSEVGQKVKADIVLYVQVDEFSLKDPAAPQLWRGRFQVTVRMVDVAEGRLWPKDRPAGYTVPIVETPVSTESAETYADDLAKQLAASVAQQVAWLFYKHPVPYEGGWGK
jgi:hypothetical protein